MADRQNEWDAPLPFANWVVGKLQDAGFQALFAGGCVRDQLMGRVPKDYDVATNALPEQVRQVFGKRRTIAVGAAFGVITVIGNSQSGNVEIATFRSDGTYTDGRRPDSVQYTDAENDALRRDFTINGLFYDPVSQTILDFVGGQQDLKHQCIQAIGDPHARFDEDKLRMLRAIRFATTLGFQIAPATMQAIQNHSAEIQTVSGERICAEMLRLLQSEQPQLGLKLLLESGLAGPVLPELTLVPESSLHQMLGSLSQQSFGHWAPEVILAFLIWLTESPNDQATLPNALASSSLDSNLERAIGRITQRWKLSNQSRDQIVACLSLYPILLHADRLPWSVAQPAVLHRWLQPALSFTRWVAEWQNVPPAGVRFCEAQALLPPAELDPPPLLTGRQLQDLGIAAGPEMGKTMRTLRQMQLDQQLTTAQQAAKYLQENGLID